MGSWVGGAVGGSRAGRGSRVVVAVGWEGQLGGRGSWVGGEVGCKGQ